MGTLTAAETAALSQMFTGGSPRLTDTRLAALDRLVCPIREAAAGWDDRASVSVRNIVLAEVHRRQAVSTGTGTTACGSR
jgi:hypothetical protein